MSIIILARNRPEHTERCLKSLARTRGVDYEIVVVDNGSDEPAREILRAAVASLKNRGVACQAVYNETNAGCSTARNQGIEMGRGECFCFLDNDTEVFDPAWLAELLSALKGEPRSGIVGPKLIFPPPGRVIQCAGGGISRSGRVVFHGRGKAADLPEFNQRRDVQFLISACMIFRRSLVDEIGGLDEAFNPVQYEDIDFCYRARSRGYRAIYVPSAEVCHDESATTYGGAGSTNAYLVIKHGLIFKNRWRHMFEKEDGPPEAETRWLKVGRWADGI